MGTAEEIVDRYFRMRTERDEARAKVEALAALLCPALERLERPADPAGPLELAARVTVLGAALRDLAPQLTPTQRAELAQFLEVTP